MNDRAFMPCHDPIVNQLHEEVHMCFVSQAASDSTGAFNPEKTWIKPVLGASIGTLREDKRDAAFRKRADEAQPNHDRQEEMLVDQLLSFWVGVSMEVASDREAVCHSNGWLVYLRLSQLSLARLSRRQKVQPTSFAE